MRALNQDGSENSTSARAAAGQEVTLLMVGYGAISNAPERGRAGFARSGGGPNGDRDGESD